MTAKGKKVVLIVDDEVDVLRLVRLSLLRDGYEVLTARDGEEGIQRVQQEMPDAMIVDVMMPGVDGLTLLKQIRENPTTNKIPVIILTQKSEYKTMREAYNVGADYYITKPFKIPQVLEGLRVVLAQAQRRQ